MISEPREKVLDLRALFGVEARITTPAAATGGEYVEMDCTLDPGAGTIIHYHPEQEETYQVLDGTLEVFRDDRWRAVPAGEAHTVPPGTVHGFRNESEAPVRFLNVHRPARAFQEHLETLDRLIQAGKIRGTKDPRSLIYMSMSAVEHRPDVAVKPPQWMIKMFAFLGRRLGYTLDWRRSIWLRCLTPAAADRLLARSTELFRYREGGTKVPRIKTTVPEEARELRGLMIKIVQRQTGGMVPGIMQVLMPDFRILIPTYWLYGHLNLRKSSPLSRLQREMLATVVNGLVGGAPWLGLHTTAVRRLTGDEHLSAEFATTWPTYELDEKTRALLTYAKKLTEEPSMVEDEDFEALREVGWDEDGIYEATALISLFNFSGRMEVASGLPMDEVPEEVRLPEAVPEK